MPVQEQTPYIKYVANGVTQTFSTEFDCESKDQLVVMLNGEEPVFTSWSYADKQVTFLIAPVADTVVELKRQSKLNRTTDYQSFNHTLNYRALNSDFDRIWYAIQEQNYKAGQYDYDYNFVLTQVRPISTGGTGADNATSARNNLDVYSKGQVDALVATGGQANIISIGGGGTGATTAEDARTNLSVPSVMEMNTAITSATPNATETIAGKAKIATIAIAKTGVNDTDFLTAKKLWDALSVTGLAPIYACRAWVNFNAVPLSGTYTQSGGTVTVTMANHGMTVGQVVNLTVTSGNAGQGNMIITSVPDVNTFTYTAVIAMNTAGNMTRNLFIKASGNITSVTDNGVGDYTINFDRPMPDANYAVTFGTSDVASGSATPKVLTGSSSATVPHLKSTYQVRVGHTSSADTFDFSVVVFR